MDRLRDVDADRATTPLRSVFVDRHGGGLALLVVGAGATALACAVAAGPRALAVLLPVAAAGFLHRRLKRIAWGKAAYITGAWLAVVVGLPALAGAAPAHVGWCAALLGTALFANAVASNVRDSEAGAQRIGAARAVLVAQAVAVAGVSMVLFAPPPTRPLAVIPMLTLVALRAFRPTERYGLVFVDGALLAGALVALALWARLF